MCFSNDFWNYLIRHSLCNIQEFDSILTGKVNEYFLISDRKITSLPIAKFTPFFIANKSDLRCSVTQVEFPRNYAQYFTGLNSEAEILKFNF